MKAIDFSRLLWLRMFAMIKDERIGQRVTVCSASLLMDDQTESISQIYLLQT